MASFNTEQNFALVHSLRVNLDLITRMYIELPNLNAIILTDEEKEEQKVINSLFEDIRTVYIMFQNIDFEGREFHFLTSFEKIVTAGKLVVENKYKVNPSLGGCFKRLALVINRVRVDIFTVATAIDRMINVINELKIIDDYVNANIKPDVTVVRVSKRINDNATFTYFLSQTDKIVKMGLQVVDNEIKIDAVEEQFDSYVNLYNIIVDIHNFSLACSDLKNVDKTLYICKQFKTFSDFVDKQRQIVE